jgi:pimeloyl-ACP methyl ester carboxylesterase
MPKVAANGIEIEYESFGEESAPAVLLIMGMGVQMVYWPEELCEGLAAHGLRAIRYDNRDVGRSTHFDHAGFVTFTEIREAMMRGEAPKTAYTLEDMAADAIGLLDALKIDRAHIVGDSMGGIIAQLIAIHYPERTLSLTSMMSTSGNPGLPRSNPEAGAALNSVAPDPAVDQEAYLQHFLNTSRAIGGRYKMSEDKVRRRMLKVAERGYNPNGVMRHMAAATVGASDKREFLQKLDVPALVIHGSDDPLIPVAAAKDTAENIPGAELVILDGVGHDFPDVSIEPIINAIVSLTKRAAPL